MTVSPSGAAAITTLRLDPALIARVDRYVKLIQRRMGKGRATCRSAVLRVLIERGIHTLAGNGNGNGMARKPALRKKRRPLRAHARKAA